MVTNVEVANYWVIALYLMRSISYLLNCIVAPDLCLPCVEVRIFPFDQ